MVHKKKILLIQASQYSKNNLLCKQKRIFLPGLIFPHLAALTPDNWTVEAIIEIIEEIPFDTSAEIIGIAVMGHAIFRGREIGLEFKKRGKIVVFGGYMASMSPWFLKGSCDSIIFGDAETAWPQLIRDYEAGSLKPEYHQPVDNLENLPLPRYELLSEKRTGFMLPVQAGRGCQHTCSFCSIACIYKGKYMPRSIQDVFRDIKRIKDLGYKGFYLVDDNLIGNSIYLDKLLDSIRPLKMFWASQCSLNLAKNPVLLKKVAKAGCRILSFGLESLSQDGVNKLNKAWLKVEDHERLLETINKVGIMPTAEFILGTDGDTVESLNALFKFVVRTKLAIPRFYILTPIPGTQLYDEFKTNGRLLHENYGLYTSTHCVFKPLQMSPGELENCYCSITSRIYSIPNIIRRVLLNRNVLKHPLLYAYAFFVNLDYRRLIRKGEAPNVH